MTSAQSSDGPFEHGIRIEQVGPRIRQAMENLSDAERLVISSCLDLGAEINGYTITDIAELNGVSPAMIVKAAKKVGLSGFRELKAVVSSYSQLPVGELHKELHHSDDSSTVAAKIFNTAIGALQETLAILNFDALSAAAEAICQASSLAFYGVGGSSALALDAYHKFLRIGMRPQVFSDSYLMIMSAASLNQAGSVLVGFSHSGQTKAIVETFRLAHGQGGKTIAVTSSAFSPLTEHSDIVLCSVAQGSPILGVNAAARIAQLAIMDALFVTVAHTIYEQSTENLRRTIDSISLIDPGSHTRW